MQAPIATKARKSGGVAWVAVTRTRAPDRKTRLPDACNPPLQERVALWSTAQGECEDSADPLKSLEGITVSH